MALFAVNTGCRDQEICGLRWEWESPIEKESVFIIPAERDKDYVFTFRSKPVTRMLNTAWKKARQRANLVQVRVHDLKHTFGRRLRAAGVSFEDRQDLLGHKSGRMTTHYSSAELNNLIKAANQVCTNRQESSSTLMLLRSLNTSSSRKSPARDFENFRSCHISA